MATSIDYELFDLSLVKRLCTILPDTQFHDLDILAKLFEAVKAVFMSTCWVLKDVMWADIKLADVAFWKQFTLFCFFEF